MTMRDDNATPGHRAEIISIMETGRTTKTAPSLGHQAAMVSADYGFLFEGAVPLVVYYTGSIVWCGNDCEARDARLEAVQLAVDGESYGEGPVILPGELSPDLLFVLDDAMWGDIGRRAALRGESAGWDTMQ